VEKSYWIVAKEVVGLWQKIVVCFVADLLLISAVSACRSLLKILISATVLVVLLDFWLG